MFIYLKAKQYSVFRLRAMITLIIICLVQFERDNEIDAGLFLGRERIKIFREKIEYKYRVLICLSRTFLENRQIDVKMCVNNL